MQERIEDMRRQDVGDKRNIEAADEIITHQIARRPEQEEKKRKAGDEVAETTEDAMQDGKDEKEEKEDMPAKKVKLQDNELENELESKNMGPEMKMEDIQTETFG